MKHIHAWIIKGVKRSSGQSGSSEIIPLVTKNRNLQGRDLLFQIRGNFVGIKLVLKYLGKK